MSICRDVSRRRKAIREHEPELNGIDYLEVDESQTILTVYFIGGTPRSLTKNNVRIDGGRRVTGIRVTEIRFCDPGDARSDGCLQVLVDRFGDFSTYTLRLVEAGADGRPGDRPLKGFDPRYAQLDFSFKVGCPSTLDCKPADDCPPDPLDEPQIDYLARDYASFRQVILDRLSLIMPDWRERHVPDLGITLVELLAYAGDTLSQYQDAVATEAYLDTARQRISVRRHAILVDYHLHDGCNARAWVAIETDTDSELGDVYFIVPLEKRLASSIGHSLSGDALRNVPFSEYEVFEPVGDQTDRRLYAAHNRLSFYTWGERECCIPKGATSATLTDQWIEQAPPVIPDDGYHDDKYCPPDPPQPPPRERRLRIQAGDVLIFEEILGPVTGVPADADPSHRHAVRLTRVEPGVDALYDTPVLEIEWAEEDALPFALCISAIGRAPECRYLTDVSIALGNVLLVDHGRTVEPEEWPVPPLAEEDSECLGEGEPREEIVPPPPFRAPVLQFGPVTHAAPFPEPRLVAKRQAQLLSTLMAAVRRRVEELWRDACDGRKLTEDELAELRTIFSDPKLDGECKKLQSLLRRFNRLLAKKSRRVRVLAARARAAYVLTELEKQELVEMFGGTIAARAGIGSQLTNGPASLALRQDPNEALPQIRVAEDGGTAEWLPRFELLDSGSRDAHFVAEIDDDGRAHVRFGDGAPGLPPDPGVTLIASYRVGNGVRGNVGSEAIAHIVFRAGVDSGRLLRARNPLAAAGGTDPQPVEEAKQYAPFAFRKRLERAITADDYARLAERGAPTRVQRAAGERFRWNGSWYEARVAIDPLRRAQLDAMLREDLQAYLHRYRRIGHDLRIGPARYVPLDVAFHVCVQPNYLRAHVEAALRGVFGTAGYFHPDNLTFGEGVHLSSLVAAAQAVAGVESVRVTRLQRQFEGPDGELESGTLQLGPLEVALLENDRSFPDRGTLTLTLEGGR
jgi:predicted phage baseplate assembly protein